MGTYYYLLNNTKKKYIHFDGYIKHGPISLNKAVHCALVNYMLENCGDSFGFVADTNSTSYFGYEELDLKDYEFSGSGVKENILSLLNE